VGGGEGGPVRRVGRLVGAPLRFGRALDRRGPRRRERLQAGRRPPRLRLGRAWPLRRGPLRPLVGGGLRRGLGQEGAPGLGGGEAGPAGRGRSDRVRVRRRVRHAGAPIGSGRNRERGRGRRRRGRRGRRRGGRCGGPGRLRIAGRIEHAGPGRYARIARCRDPRPSVRIVTLRAIGRAASSQRYVGGLVRGPGDDQAGHAYPADRAGGSRRGRTGRVVAVPGRELVHASPPTCHRRTGLAGPVRRVPASPKGATFRQVPKAGGAGGTGPVRTGTGR